MSQQDIIAVVRSAIEAVTAEYFNGYISAVQYASRIRGLHEELEAVGGVL